MLPLDALRHRFDDLIAGYDIGPSFKRFPMTATQSGDAHAELNGETYAYVVTERGQELQRRETNGPDELLYWFVSDVTWAAASKYELAHRQSGVDSRRLLFRTHVELLTAARAEWGRRKQLEYDDVLRRYPFSDAT